MSNVLKMFSANFSAFPLDEGSGCSLNYVKVICFVLTLCVRSLLRYKSFFKSLKRPTWERFLSTWQQTLVCPVHHLGNPSGNPHTIPARTKINYYVLLQYFYNTSMSVLSIPVSRWRTSTSSLESFDWFFPIPGLLKGGLRRV